MNTLVDVSLKKINFYGNRKKLQLLNYFKGKSIVSLVSEQKSLLQKLQKIKKDYKALEKNIFLDMSGYSLNTLNTLRIRH